MNADTFFITGKQHTVCQDYAAAGQTACHTYAVVSDGCSTSPDTDFGSRFLTQSAIHVLRLYRSIDPVCLIETAAYMAGPVRIHEQALDATLLIAYSDGREVITQVWGDGVIAARRRDGALQVYQVEFPSGAPAYLNYWRNPQRLDGFISKYGAIRRMTVSGYGTLQDCAVGDAQKDPVGITMRFPHEIYDLVAVFTDGVQSFRKRCGHYYESVPALEVVSNLMAFKNVQGQFVARRCKAFFKQAEADGWQWGDDVSVAAIHTGESPASGGAK